MISRLAATAGGIPVVPRPGQTLPGPYDEPWKSWANSEILVYSLVTYEKNNKNWPFIVDIPIKHGDSP